MTSEPIRFNDGAGYDRFMGVWSRLAGQDFLDWIGPSQGQRWLDVGCGNGAFTQLIAEQCKALMLVGIDPSEAQLAYARQQPLLQTVDFVNADAMALPFPDDLDNIHTRVITVKRTYTDFDDLWKTVLGGPSAGQALAVMGEADVSRFREVLRKRLQPAGSGSISLTGRAHAIRGSVGKGGGVRSAANQKRTG